VRGGSPSGAGELNERKKVKLITKAIEKAFERNMKLDEKDRKPVLKLFGGGAATWLISEYDPDTGLMFGLADLGMGMPEMGYIDFNELAALRFPPFGLPIERDMYFKANKTLSEYADDARGAGRIAA